MFVDWQPHINGNLSFFGWFWKIPANETTKIKKTTTLMCLCIDCLAESFQIPRPTDFHFWRLDLSVKIMFDCIKLLAMHSFVTCQIMNLSVSFNAFVIIYVEWSVYINLFRTFLYFYLVVFFISLIRRYLIAFYDDFLGRLSFHVQMWFIKFLFLNRRIIITCLLK